MTTRERWIAIRSINMVAMCLALFASGLISLYERFEVTGSISTGTQVVFLSSLLLFVVFYSPATEKITSVRAQMGITLISWTLAVHTTMFFFVEDDRGVGCMILAIIISIIPMMVSRHLSRRVIPRHKRHDSLVYHIA